MEMCHEKLTAIQGVTCVRPKGALYLFPKIDLKQFNFKDDDAFILGLLEEHHILVVAGNGFNYPTKDHFRIVFLPSVEALGAAMDKLTLFLENNRR